jgi:C1A family cysteine protease
MSHKYGLIKDKEDKRDFIYQAKLGMTALPVKIDLRRSCPPIRDQGQLGSCTWEAMVGFYETLAKHNHLKVVRLSVLFGYYNTRVIENSVNIDCGAELRDCWKSFQKTGDCPNLYWPYYIKRFKTKPSARAYLQSTYKVATYNRIYTLEDIKLCLSDNHPVVIGFAVYSSFESDHMAKTGIMPMPKPEEKCLGGHAVLVVGYDEVHQWLIVRNSWGNRWGARGYFFMPYAFVTSDQVFDMWTATI